MITIELTETQIEHLVEGADNFGRCSMILEAKDGIPVIVVITKTNRRGRPRRASGYQAAEPALEALSSGGRNGPAPLDKFAQEWQDEQVRAAKDTPA